MCFSGGLSGQKSSGHSNNTAAVVCLSLLLIVLLMVLVKMYMNYQRVKTFNLHIIEILHNSVYYF